MENYKQSAKVGQEMILTYLKNRMKEKKVTQQEVADTLEVGRATVVRWFKMATPMPLGSYLEICRLLKLRPYLIPAEDDTWSIDLLGNKDTVESYLYLESVVSEKYHQDNVCIGDFKADHINSRILEWADDMAETLTEKDCEIAKITCYKTEMEGDVEVQSYTEEAQDIFNEYYDEQVDSFYLFLNTINEIEQTK